IARNTCQQNTVAATTNNRPCQETGRYTHPHRRNQRFFILSSRKKRRNGRLALYHKAFTRQAQLQPPSAEDAITLRRSIHDTGWTLSSNLVNMARRLVPGGTVRK